MSAKRPSVRVDDPNTRHDMAEWVAQWRRVGPALERERTAELQMLSEEDSGRIAAELVWPLGTLGSHRGGDDGAGLEVIGRLQRVLAARG